LPGLIAGGFMDEAREFEQRYVFSALSLRAVFAISLSGQHRPGSSATNARLPNSIVVL
jgi:hypothetical protein